VVNKIVGNTWKRATRGLSKRELKDAILRYPDLLKDLISLYKKKRATHYDFAKDPEGHLAWYDTAVEFAARYPLPLVQPSPPSPEAVLQLVLAIADHFKRLVERNGLNRLLYERSHRLRHETFAQLLFFGIADAFCEANNVDLSREPNAGRGPVDFKVSSGYLSRVLVEVKYSSNRNLRAGFESQLPTYAKSERTSSTIFLIIRTTESTSQIDRVRRARSKALKEGRRVPELVVIDARLKPSASKVWR
jgi:hypothetical protein